LFAQDQDALVTFETRDAGVIRDVDVPADLTAMT